MDGLETLIMNLYRNIDRRKVQFDFLVHHDKIGMYEEEIKRLGGKIHRIPFVKKVGHFGYIEALDNFFKNNNYDIVHSHYDQITGFILRSAKNNNVKVRIAHSHSTGNSNNFLVNLYKKYAQSFINDTSTDRFACGKDAGNWLYGKKKDFKILNNGIDLSNFNFDLALKNNKKKELNLESDEILIGHVGRFDEVKNHKFLLEIFNEILKIKEKSKLILIGDGILRSEIEEQIARDNLQDKVILLGVRKDVKELLNILDLVIFPSFYEGIPLTLIENQCNGLKSYISNNVSKEVDMKCNLVEFIPLEKSPEEWARIISKDLKSRNNVDTERIKLALKNSGYDIKEIAKWLENYYIKYNKFLR